jgi:hypothetical protein
MELIEKRVQDALDFTEAHLAVPALPPRARTQLGGQRDAYRDVLRWLAAYKQAHANHLMDVLGKDMARILHEEDE